MVDDITHKKVDIVIVKDLSRLGRNYIEVGELLDSILPLYNVKLISINDNIDGLNDEEDSYLLKGLNTKINNLSKKSIKFENMCAEGQTKDGQKFIENFLNLKEKLVTKEGYKLYCFNSTDEMNEWIDTFPLYIERYNSTLK